MLFRSTKKKEQHEKIENIKKKQREDREKKKKEKSTGEVPSANTAAPRKTPPAQIKPTPPRIKPPKLKLKDLKFQYPKKEKTAEEHGAVGVPDAAPAAADDGGKVQYRKTNKVRKCAVCQTIWDRDVNGALNLLFIAFELLINGVRPEYLKKSLLTNGGTKVYTRPSRCWTNVQTNGKPFSIRPSDV